MREDVAADGVAATEGAKRGLPVQHRQGPLLTHVEVFTFGQQIWVVIHVLLSGVPDTHHDQSVNLGGNR